MKSLAPLQAFRPSSSGNWLERFGRFPSGTFASLWKSAGEDFWRGRGERRARDLFHAAAARVPAYKDFLKKHRISAAKIKTMEDFAQVPPTTKENYISAYPIEARMWDGEFGAARLVAVSSGTSGEPQYWPRGDEQEFEAAAVHELLFRSWYEIDRYRTLLLVGFPVGIYVSGVATLLPSWLTASRGYSLTVVAVGNNRAEMVRTLERLAPRYEQVIIAGHPFFIKDSLEAARAGGVRLPKRLKTFMCSEGFSESWRTYLATLAGSRDPDNFLSTYGSSELLLMAYETPLSIALRRAPAFRALCAKRIVTPSLFQYNPFLRYIESVEGELVFTAESGIPLIRFNIHDSGEVIPYRDMRARVPLRRDAPGWKLPFVTLHGRSDRTLVFYAANIYPEHVKAALDHPSFTRILTGKFVMWKEYLRNMDQYLEVAVELRQGLAPKKPLAARITQAIVRTLHALNLEYKDASKQMSKDLTPRVRLCAYQDKVHFPPGVKPKYIVS